MLPRNGLHRIHAAFDDHRLVYAVPGGAMSASWTG